MKTGINSKKMNLLRRILTPVLVVALVLTGLWLPEVKVKAWDPGDEVQLTITYEFGEGKIYVNEQEMSSYPQTVESSEYSSTYNAYKFVVELNHIPVYNDEYHSYIPDKFMGIPDDLYIVDEQSEFVNPSYIRIGHEIEFWVLADSFNGDGEGRITLSNTNYNQPVGKEISFYYHEVQNIPKNEFSARVIRAEYDGSNLMYYYNITVPNDDTSNFIRPTTQGLARFGGIYHSDDLNGYSFYPDSGENINSETSFNEGTEYIIVGNSSDNNRVDFEPEYTTAKINVIFDAGSGYTLSDDGFDTELQTKTEEVDLNYEEMNYISYEEILPPPGIFSNGVSVSGFRGWKLEDYSYVSVLSNGYELSANDPTIDGVTFNVNKDYILSSETGEHANVIRFVPVIESGNWTDGDPATLVVDFYDEWNTKDVYPESLTLTGQKNENGVYEFTAAGNMLNKAPNKQGKLANSFMITDQTSVTIKGRNRDFNIANKDVVFLASDASIFENGVAHVTIRAYFDEWSSGIKTKFYYYPAHDGTEKTVTWAERDENGNISKYYYEIDIYSLQGFYGDFTGEYLLPDNDSITVYEVSDTGVATQVTSMRSDNHYRIDTGNNIIDEIRFTPVFTAPSSGTFNAYVNFDALERGTIAGEDRINSTFNYDQSSDSYEATIQGDDIPTVTANQGESFNGYFLEVSDALENNKIRLVNTNDEDITVLTPGTDFKIILDKDYAINTEMGELPLTFKAQYDEHFTLNVNFAISSSDNMQPFPSGSKYLDSYELPISTGTSDYYEVTIAGSRIDEDLALKDTNGKTHLLKGFIPNSDVLYENAGTIPLGQETTLKFKHSAFQNGSATLTLTAVFSDDIDYTVKNAHNLAGSVFEFQSFTTINGAEYGLYTGNITSASTWVTGEDNLPDGMIKYAGYWNCSDPDAFFSSSGNEEVTKILLNTQYNLYIKKTRIDSDPNNTRYIYITPGKKLEMSITFDAGANGTITGEGSSTTKTVEAGTETYNASNNTWTGDITLPTVTPKDGYTFKQWTQQELSDLLDRDFTGTSASFSIGDSAARSRTEGFTYIAEYFHCDIKVVYGYGAHSAITGSNPVPVQVSSSGYSDGAYTFRLTFPDANSYTAAEGYTLNHFTMSQNGYSVSRASNGMAISTSDRFSPGETVDIMLNPGTDTDVTISFTAQYEERTALKVSFVDNTHAFGPFYPSPLQADSDGYYTFSLTIPNLLGNNDGFGYVFMRNKINNQNYSVLFYRGSEEAGYRDAFDNETVTVKAKVNDSASGNMIDLGIWGGTKGIKQSGEYMVPTSTNVSDENKVYLTKGTWEVSHNGTSDGYTYSVSEPALISSSYSDSLTFTKK